MQREHNYSWIGAATAVYRSGKARHHARLDSASPPKTGSGVEDLKFMLPDEMARTISSSWKHSWLMKSVPECWKPFNGGVLWEPAKYSIVTSDQADWTIADGGATDI